MSPTAAQVNDRLTKEINDRATETKALKARVAALEAAAPPPVITPVPSPVTTTIPASLLQTALGNETLDVILLEPGTVTLPQIKLPNRKRPVAVRPVTPGTVVLRQGTANEGAFQGGYNSVAANVNIFGLILDGYVIGPTGLVWLGNAHDLVFSDITVRNCRAASGTSSDNAWALYCSYDAGVGASRIIADRWTVTGQNRSLSGLQLQYAAMHTSIWAAGWRVSGLAFALYAKANAEDVQFSDWDISDCGIRSSSVYFGDWSPTEPLKGTYSRLALTGSLPLLREAAGMVAA